MSVMVGSVTESLAPDGNFLQGVNATLDEGARDHFRVQLASTLSILVGLFQVQSRRENMTPPTPPCPSPASSPQCLPIPVLLLPLAVTSSPHPLPWALL